MELIWQHLLCSEMEVGESLTWEICRQLGEATQNHFCYNNVRGRRRPRNGADALKDQAGAVGMLLPRLRIPDGEDQR